MKFILGIKKNMTQVFDADGIVHPVTVIGVGPVTVTQIKKKEEDGYDAIQVGYGEKNKKKINKALLGHMKDLGNFRFLKEFRVNDVSKDELKVGDKISVSSFENLEKVTVTSTSKGKGFQGVVKRYGFHGDKRTHGRKHSERKPGSIGSTGPQKVLKGKRMAGRMGGDTITTKNLKIIKIDESKNEIFLKGAVPGTRGTLVEIISK